MTVAERDKAERLTNGIYGTILVTAFLGAVDGLTSDAVEVFTELVATSLVVFIAHTYSSVLGTGVTELGQWRSHLVTTIANQLPLVAVLTVPALLLGISVVNLLPLTTAIRVAIGAGLAALFLLGYLVADERGSTALPALASGAAAAILGFFVVGLEAAMH